MILKKEYWIIFAIIVTEVLGFSLILPFLPFYAEQMGASPLVVGLILTSFSFFQFISAPVMGRLSDYYGRKPLLILSQISTFISFLILGFANALWMIFASRIVDGLLGSNFTISQAYLSDISSKKDRSKVFGLTGVAFGFAFMIGPAMGGFLSQWGYALPSLVAAAVSLASIFATLIFLPETVKRKKKGKIEVKIIDLKSFKKYFSLPQTSSMMLQFFMYFLAHVMWISMFALYAERQLSMGAIHIGYLLTYVGLIAIVFRGIILQKLIDLFDESLLQLAGGISMTLGLVAAIFISQQWMMAGIMTFFAVGNSLLRPLFLGEISRSVSEKEQGAVLGLTNSLGSLAQIIAPLIGGFVIGNFTPGALGFVAAAAMFLPLSVLVKENWSRLTKI